MYRGRRRTSKRSYRPRRVYKRAAKKRFHKFAVRVLRVANEKKYVEFLSTINNPATSANDDIFTLCLTTVAQGDGESTRDGNQLALRSLDVRVRAAVSQEYLARLKTAPAPDNPYGPGATAELQGWFNDKVRVIIWQWLPASDSAVAAGGALPGSVLQAETTISPYNHDERRNFRILYDKTQRLAGNFFEIPASATPAMIGFPMHELADFHVRIRKFGSRVVQWIGSGVSTEANNHIYMSVITDWSQSTGEPDVSPVLVYYHCKTNFSDK